jgi:hypothetical protein
MKTVLDRIKDISSILVAVFVILIVIVPYVIMIIYLRKTGQTIQIHPEFKIKSIERNNNIDTEVLGNAVNHAEEIYKKIRGDK